MYKVLWLCSWYPHPGDPFEGDFIQRHARAVSAYTPLTVFYTSQAGAQVSVKKECHIEQQTEDVRERIMLFRHRKTGFSVIDKFVYNIRYFRSYKKAIRQYIRKHGRPDIVHVHIPMKAGMIGRWIKRTWNIPFVVSEHSAHYNSESNDSFYSKSSFHRYHVKRILQEAAAVTNVSEAVGNTLKSLFGLNAVRVIPNTVNTTFFYYRHQPPLRFRFIHVSTLVSHQKNVEGILNAVLLLSKQRQDFEMVIVGPANDNLREKVVNMGFTQVIRFTGEISYPDVALEMQQASALVLFSRYENLPCVVLEALCCGLPVISSDTGGIKEAVNETNGILVQSESETQLAEAMNTMMNEYEKYDRGKIAIAATERYKYETIGRKFYELYDEVLKDRRT
jgi:glycosyltransferase involved in cell wall biosynthesis